MLPKAEILTEEKRKRSLLDERLAYLDYVTEIISCRACPLSSANSASFKTQTSLSMCLLCSGITVILNNCDSQLHFNEVIWLTTVNHCPHECNFLCILTHYIPVTLLELISHIPDLFSNYKSFGFWWWWFQNKV